MAVGVAVVYNNSYHSPGYEITVTGLASFNRLTIERVDPSGEYRDTPVRGAEGISISDPSFVVTDFEAPVGKSFAYRVTADGVATGATMLTDNFSRTLASDWGSSSGGLTWTKQAGVSNTASVNGSAGVITINANSDPVTMTLAPTLSDFDMYFDVSSSAVGSGAQITAGLVCGYQDESNFYRFEIRFTTDSTMDILVRRQVSGTLVNLSARNDVVTYTAGGWYSVRCKSEAGAMSIKVWPQGTAEPVDWWITTTPDTTFTSGLVGLQALTGSANTNTKPITMSFDNVSLPGSGDTSLVTEVVTSPGTLPITPDHAGTVWVKSIGQPALSRRVNMTDFNEVTRPGRILGEYEVLGRPNKVVLTDVMGGREGTVVISTYPMGGVWESDSSTRDLQVLLQFGGTLLMQTAGPAVTGEEDMYFEVKNFSRKRIGPVGGELTHLHTIEFIEVDRPATSQESLALRNWQSVIDQNGTWADVLTNHSTWLDVLQRNL